MTGSTTPVDRAQRMRNALDPVFALGPDFLAGERDADDMAHAIEQGEENTKANELLFRRAAVEDIAEAHVVAMERAPELGFDTFIVAAPTPFVPADARALMADAPAVVRRYYPEYAAIYERLEWTMFRSIDRVYDAGKAERVLGFRCRHDFGAALRALAQRN